MTPDEIREAERKDYGQYVAKVDIFAGTARAFNAGDPVPASHVERGVVSRDDVIGAASKTAKSLTAQES